MASKKRDYSDFAATVEGFAELSKKRMLTVVRLSIDDTIEIAQTPVGKGGRMRVDTGFLRKSGQASLTGMPTGPARGELTAPHSYDDGNAPISATVNEALGQLKLGDRFYFGWTANYAKFREAYDGFLEGAAQQWKNTVTKNVAKARAGRKD